jgi:pimeloyl-ACP methyl ester carboxylesterase
VTTFTSNLVDPAAVEGAAFSVSDVRADDGVTLRVMRWRPRGEPDEAPLVFVAGWVSSVEGWASMLREAARDRDVYYLESREKVSASIDRAGLRAADFAIDRLAGDLVAVCAELGLDDGRTVFAGSSVGSTTILEALKGERLRARGAFVIGPNARFRYPLWGRALIRLPAATYTAAKEIVLFYLRHFRVDAQREPGQMERYERTIRRAHAERIRLSAQAFERYEIWPDLETIAAPVAVASAHSDKLHDGEGIRRIVETIPRCEHVACPSNLYMHGPKIVEDLRRFIARLAPPTLT